MNHRPGTRVTLGQAATCLALLVILLWLAILTYWQVGTYSDRMSALQLVSFGMYRDDVVDRLGEPRAVLKQSPILLGSGEVLAYSSWRESRQDFLVVLDSHGRVVAVHYPLSDRELQYGIRIPSDFGRESRPGAR